MRKPVLMRFLSFVRSGLVLDIPHFHLRNSNSNKENFKKVVPTSPLGLPQTPFDICAVFAENSWLLFCWILQFHRFGKWRDSSVASVRKRPLLWFDVGVVTERAKAERKRRKKNWRKGEDEWREVCRARTRVRRSVWRICQGEGGTRCYGAFSHYFPLTFDHDRLSFDRCYYCVQRAWPIRAAWHLRGMFKHDLQQHGRRRRRSAAR